MPSSLYSWAGDIETQIKSFNRLIFNYKVHIEYDPFKSERHGGDIMYHIEESLVALFRAEITISSYLINPEFLLTIRIKHPDEDNDSPKNYSLIEGKNVFDVPEVRVVEENEQKKIYLYWCSFSTEKTKEYRLGEIREGYDEEAENIIPHIIWVENLSEEIRSRYKTWSWHGNYGYFKTELRADNLNNDVYIKNDVVGIL